MRSLTLVSLLLLALPARGAVIALSREGPDNPNISEEELREHPTELQMSLSDLSGGPEKLGQACLAMECQENGQPDCPDPPDGYVASQKLCDDLKNMLGESLRLHSHSNKGCEDGGPPVGSRVFDGMVWEMVKQVLGLIIPWPFSLIFDYV